jgi:REP element-mobilizing transposase RayT
MSRSHNFLPLPRESFRVAFLPKSYCSPYFSNFIILRVQFTSEYQMSRSHKFHNPQGLYFVSFAVTDWIDVFTKRNYVDIVLECLRFCQEKKGMEIFAWVVMSNHVHLVFRSVEGQKPELLLGDFKRFTSKKLVEAIKENPNESRKEWMLEQFALAAENSSNVKHHQFWRHDNKPIELWSNAVIDEKIDYIHNNPVNAGIVEQPEHYLLSSASDYAGSKGLLENVIVAW